MTPLYVLTFQDDTPSMFLPTQDDPFMPSLTKDVSPVGTRDSYVFTPSPLLMIPRTPYVPTNQDDPPYLFPPKVGQGRHKGDHSEWVMT